MIYFFITNHQHYKYAFSDLNQNQKVCCYGKMHTIFRHIRIKSIGILELLFFGRKKHCFKAGDILCFSDGAYRKLPRDFLYEFKKKHPEIKTVLLLYNKVALLYGEKGNIQLSELKDRERILPFDAIYSYDLDEVKAFGFEYFELYSKSRAFDTCELENDVYYCGSVAKDWKKTRAIVVNDIYNYLCSNDVKLEFHLISEKDVKNLDYEFVQKKRVKYREILEGVSKSNVILEIVTDGKYGATFRYCEAVTYNKKLLTNNPRIKEMPFYDERYMKYFEKIEDIDIEWCKAKCTVDYGYKGEFSPKYFEEKVKSVFKEKK